MPSDNPLFCAAGCSSLRDGLRRRGRGKQDVEHSGHDVDLNRGDGLASQNATLQFQFDRPLLFGEGRQHGDLEPILVDELRELLDLRPMFHGGPGDIDPLAEKAVARFQQTIPSAGPGRIDLDERQADDSVWAFLQVVPHRLACEPQVRKLGLEFFLRQQLAETIAATAERCHRERLDPHVVLQRPGDDRILLQQLRRLVAKVVVLLGSMAGVQVGRAQPAPLLQSFERFFAASSPSSETIPVAARMRGSVSR